MNQDVTKKDPAVVFKDQVSKTQHEFRAALPAHIPVERFMRVIMTAVVNNPALLDADRRSLFEAAMKAAQDGLLPDTREGALVIFGKRVQWMPMIGGILKKVRNSGELVSIAAHVAYSNDDFTYELGDEEGIHHKPALEERGRPRLVYAIAKTKDGGIYREIMTVGDVERVRAVSRAANNGPWVSWWDEMARKTVLRRLSKRLPMSSDLDDLIRRDDSLYDFDHAKQPRIKALENPTERLKMDMEELAAEGNGNGEAAPHITPQAAARAQNDAWPANDPAHNPETGEIISKEMAAKAQEAGEAQRRFHEDALADQTGEKAGGLLKERLDERAVTATGGTSMYERERAKLATEPRGKNRP